MIRRGAIAGFRLTQRTRVGEVGTWTTALAPDGRPAGALLFDPRLIGAADARARLVASVAEDRRLVDEVFGGLVPVVDLVAAGDEVWLLTGLPAAPVVTDLLNDPRLDAGSAASILVEIAQTLEALHAAGLAHGAVHTGTIVISEDGSALLAERGLRDAVQGRPAAPERDIAAWTALARGLSAGWADGSPGAAALFDRAAGTASTLGLGAAREVLMDGRGLLPSGLIRRYRLMEAVRAWRDLAVQVPTGPTFPEQQPVFPPDGRVGRADLVGRADPVGRADRAERDEGDIVTLLHQPAPAPTEDVVMRFGPGVPSETTAAAIWRTGRDQLATLDQGRPRARHAPPRRRRHQTALAASLLALLAAGAILAWLLRGPSLEVAAVSVKAPRQTQTCDAKVVITGVISTNGAAGEVRYRWVRSDRDSAIEQTDSVPSGVTSHDVRLEWTVKGEGSFKGSATLQVLSPVPGDEPIEGEAGFTYRCR